MRLATADDADFLTDMLVAAVNRDPAARQAVGRDRVLMDCRLAHYVEGRLRVGDRAMAGARFECGHLVERSAILAA